MACVFVCGCRMIEAVCLFCYKRLKNTKPASPTTSSTPPNNARPPGVLTSNTCIRNCHGLVWFVWAKVGVAPLGGMSFGWFPEAAAGVLTEALGVGDLFCPRIEGVIAPPCCPNAGAACDCALLLAGVVPPLVGAIPRRPDSRKTMPRIAAIVLTVRSIPCI
jgi:hypothetical protein